MRVSLFILGVFVAVVCIKNPLKRKPIRGASITIEAAEPRIAGFQRFNNAWRPGLGTATRVDPIRSTKACRGPLHLGA